MTSTWPSNDFSRLNQWHHLMSPSKPYNFCLKHFCLLRLVFEIFQCLQINRPPCIRIKFDEFSQINQRPSLWKLFAYLTCLILRCDARRKEMSLVDLMDLVKLGGAYLHDPDVSGVDPVLVKRQEVIPRNSYQNPASVWSAPRTIDLP